MNVADRVAQRPVASEGKQQVLEAARCFAYVPVAGRILRLPDTPQAGLCCTTGPAGSRRVDKKRTYLWGSVGAAWITPAVGVLVFSFGMGPSASSTMAPAILAGGLMIAVAAAWLQLLLGSLLVWLLGKSRLARTVFVVHLAIAGLAGLLALAV